jgi:hypothetical protein
MERPYQVFFSYAEPNRPFVEALAKRLSGDARVRFWFEPWHAVPGVSRQTQMLEAFQASDCCAVFLGGATAEGFHDKQIQLAIQRQVEVDPEYRVIPVVLPGVPGQVPGFLGLNAEVRFSSLEDEEALSRLLSGIFGVPPVRLMDFVQKRITQELLSPRAPGFQSGHALAIGIASYPHLQPLGDYTLNDARDVADLLTDRTRCGYPSGQVKVLLDQEATLEHIRLELKQLAERVDSGDTAVLFFSGHGVRNADGGKQYLAPHGCDRKHLDSTALPVEELMAWSEGLRADRLLVILDCCHAGAAAESKSAESPEPRLTGLDEAHYRMLVTGRGRVVLASCRPGEESYAERDSRNSIFTRFLLQALRGEARTLGDGAVRVFDLFRHVSDKVPPYVERLGDRQTPLFKAVALDSDFVVAMCRR